MSRYRAYAEYKDSGVEWLGDIPKNWELKRVKEVATLINGYPFDSKKFESGKGTPLVRIRDINSSMTEVGFDGEVPKDALIKNGDILIGMDGDFNVAIWRGGDAALNQRVACIRADNYELQKFVFYTLPFNMKIVNDLTYFTTVKHLSSIDILKSRMSLPPLDDLPKIVNFLDHETAKIDTLIAKQQQLIRLLKEKRQAVISHAVTKGLNSSAPMRDSGVEWLGDVPKHWDVLSLGKVTLSKCDGPFGSGLKSEHYTESGVRVIRLQNIKIGNYFEGDGAFIDEEYYKNNLRNHDVVAGDILIAGLGDPGNPVGRACVAPEGISPAMVKADCFRFRLDEEKVIPDFIAQQLSSSSFYDAGKLSNGSTRARIPLSLMATRKIAICPLDEQKQILNRIAKLSGKYDKLEKEAASAIELMQERRTALISAAVTGKIDVRDWQPASTSLPLEAAA